MEIVNSLVGERVHTYLERLTPFGFAGAVLVSIQGDMHLNHGYGLANRSTGALNRAETIFNLGSITKQFTAAAILRLELDGLLNTNDTIDRYFPAAPSEKQTVTIHHLLTHTGGMPLYSGEDYEVAGREETMQKILDAPLEFTPGSAFSYSNTGYSLLAAIIELVSGKQYEQFLSERLLHPAGMHSTGYRMPAWDIGKLAHGYIQGQDMGTPLEKIYPSWNVMGNGEMLSTTMDLYRWYLALKRGQALPYEAREKLWTPFLQDYAYGWRVHENEFGPVVEHSGGGATGMSADIKWYTNQDILVVIFSNQTLANGSLPIRVVDKKISSLLFDHAITQPPVLPNYQGHVNSEEIEGMYLLENEAEFTVLHQTEGLVLQPENQDAINLILNADSISQELNRDRNQRVEKAFGSLVEGDLIPLVTELGDQKRAERYQKYLDELFNNSVGEPTESHQEIRWKLLGTMPDPGMTRQITRMVIDYGGAMVTLEVHWEKEKILGISILDGFSPTRIPLRPFDENHFVGYDLASSRVLNVKFEPLKNEGWKLVVF